MIKIILIDDSLIFRERLVDFFRMYPNVEVVGQFEDTQTAMEHIPSLDPDLILMDIVFKKSSGLKFLNEVKISRPKIKVIIVTNYTYSTFREMCLNLGCDYFFDKSFEYENLFELLETLVRKEDCLIGSA